MEEDEEVIRAKARLSDLLYLVRNACLARAEQHELVKPLREKVNQLNIQLDQSRKEENIELYTRLFHEKRALQKQLHEQEETLSQKEELENNLRESYFHLERTLYP